MTSVLSGHLSTEDLHTALKDFIMLGDGEQQQAVVLKALTRDVGAVLHWIRLQQIRQWNLKPRLAFLYDASFLAEWEIRWKSHVTVTNALASPQHTMRQSLEKFAAEFDTHCAVRRLHRKGLKVPANFLMVKYIRSLSLRSQGDEVKKHLQTLKEKSSRAKKWRRAFRKRWGLEWGNGHLQHGLTQQTARSRAAIFFRWMAAVRREIGEDRNSLVVNMDETMLSNVRPCKVGVVPSATTCIASNIEVGPAEQALPRTSLVAVVCNDACLQKCLPQLRLPRGKTNVRKRGAVATAYSLAGYPQAVLHGGGGWNNNVTMVWWLRELRRRVRLLAPGRPIILVMDDCSIHIAEKVLDSCRRLCIAAVIIPSKMTWTLQPLDTHVFAQLKSSIRSSVFEALASSENGRIRPVERIRLHGIAVRDVLVQKDWGRVMERSGLLGTTGDLRAAVQELIEHEDVAGRFPSEDELRYALSAPVSRCGKLRQQLIATAKAAAQQHAVDDGVDSQVENQNQKKPTAKILPVPMLRLSRSARLPSAPASARPPATALLYQRPPEQNQIMTRKRSRLALESGGASASNTPAGTSPL